jgi:hypothetical protein
MIVSQVGRTIERLLELASGTGDEPRRRRPGLAGGGA